MIRLSGRNFWLLAASICIGGCAFLLRLFNLGEQELWFDEVHSFFRATLQDGFFEGLRIDNNPPLYYLLLRFWLSFGGTSEAAVRLPSAILGTFCVLAVIWAGWLIFNPVVGLWAGAFAAVAPIHVYYSQEARMYALLTFEMAMTYALLWRAMRVNTRSAWGLFSVAALTALYSHYFTALGFIPAFLVLWVWPRDSQSPLRRKRFVIASLACVLLWLPWLALTVFPYTHAITFLTTGWVTQLWQATPPAMIIPRTLEVLLLGPQRDMVIISMKQFAGLTFPDSLRWLSLGLLGGLALWVAVPWKDSGLHIPWLGRRKAWVASFLLTPLLLLWIVSFYRPIYILGRYDMVGFVGFALMVGLALAKLQSVRRVGHVLAVMAALGLLIPIGSKLMRYYHAPAPRYAEETARAIHQLVGNGEVLVLSQHRGIPLLIYYLPRQGYEWKNDVCRNVLSRREFTCRLFLPEAELVTSWSPKFTHDMVRAFVDGSLTPIKATGGRVWAVLGDIRLDDGSLNGYGLDDLVLVELQRAGGLRAELIRFNGPPVLFRFQRDPS